MNKKRTVPIYKAPSYTKATANDFVIAFFNKINLDAADLEVIYYQDEGVYWLRDENTYNIWFHYLDGSYRYKDFSSFDEELKDADEEMLKEHVSKFGIEIPQASSFQQVDTGTYEWTVDKEVRENHLIDGFLTVKYYNDNTVKEIDNRFITYDKVRDVQIKSEQQAYNDLTEGRFTYYSENNNVKTLHITKVEVTYHLDSKGFYQPVYAFHSIVDGLETKILLPGM
ncbi:hypothetical protein [Bacillus sp. FJAT-50079]|uniref:hypothetical protein n=1 Tax=Bacillus sp. FJAT-50079 TaxID=2833577 RepID=UPI001BC9BABE|nr:hypothetical protein [Bacillus sp. FJAT-50079]MBS4207321.1 hypothetical protein [Bacillus sp. FJAT-50079]